MSPAQQIQHNNKFKINSPIYAIGQDTQHAMNTFNFAKGDF